VGSRSKKKKKREENVDHILRTLRDSGSVRQLDNNPSVAHSFFYFGPESAPLWFMAYNWPIFSSWPAVNPFSKEKRKKKKVNHSLFSFRPKSACVNNLHHWQSPVTVTGLLPAILLSPPTAFY
jgi:hypothetical protein